MYTRRYYDQRTGDKILKYSSVKKLEVNPEIFRLNLHVIFIANQHPILKVNVKCWYLRFLVRQYNM